LISQDSIQQILSRIDIVEIVGSFVKLKKRGTNYLGLCPFHNEKTPSFTVSPAKEIYKCFGCGRSGNSIGFLMEAEKYSYVEALRWLAAKYNVEIEETATSPEYKQQQQVADSLYIINNFAQQYFTDALLKSEEGQDIALSYLKERGFREEIINKFQLGYNPEARDGFTKAARITELQKQLETNHAEIASTRETLEQFNTQLKELTEKTQLVEQDYAAAEAGYNIATATFNDSNLQFTKQQSKVVSLKQEFEFKSNQLNDLKVQIESSNTQLNEAAISITQTAEELSGLETLLITMLHNKETEEKALNEADQLYYNLRNALSEKETELKSKHRSKEGIDSLLTEIKDKLTDLKLQLAGMKERLNVEFKVDLDIIIDEPRTTDTPLEELREKNERQRKRLENIGEINPTAIEAYTEMKKRYDFILEQKNDLVTARESLMLTIQEVEATANQQFLETFNKVRENFQKVFQALFTEDDTADMIMVDPENLADTAIDIIAKPKGKRPSSIGQLSGGEKTLTATALLFAIYLIKPAPFCILDEVDAPLDDANVGKFTQMIKQFSANSQFIIVTHNKMTMSAVDVIYGVTMQEAGVSKLVPVDFRSLN